MTHVFLTRRSSDLNTRGLEVALDNMSQGISVCDAQLRLVAWNRRSAELFDFPQELLRICRPIADLSRWKLSRLPPGGDLESALQRRLAFMSPGSPHLTAQVMPDGRHVEHSGKPKTGGGIAAPDTDEKELRQVTRRKREVEG